MTECHRVTLVSSSFRLALLLRNQGVRLKRRQLTLATARDLRWRQHDRADQLQKSWIRGLFCHDGPHMKMTSQQRQPGQTIMKMHVPVHPQHRGRSLEVTQQNAIMTNCLKQRIAKILPPPAPSAKSWLPVMKSDLSRVRQSHD